MRLARVAAQAATGICRICGPRLQACGRIGELFAIDAEVAPRGPTGRVSSMPGRARSFPSNRTLVDVIASRARWYATQQMVVWKCQTTLPSGDPPSILEQKILFAGFDSGGVLPQNVRSREDPKR